MAGIAVPAEGQGGPFPPSLQNLSKIKNFRAAMGKFGQNQELLASDKKLLEQNKFLMNAVNAEKSLRFKAFFLENTMCWV